MDFSNMFKNCPYAFLPESGGLKESRAEYPKCHHCKRADMETVGNCDTIRECPDCHAEVSDAWLRGFWHGYKSKTAGTVPTESVTSPQIDFCPACGTALGVED